MIKTRFKPLFRSYVCSDRPTEVVIWKVVLPRGREVKGTSVGDTRPTVYDVVSQHSKHLGSSMRLTLNGAKILDLCTSGAELFSRLASSFARFATGPLEIPSGRIGAGIVRAAPFRLFWEGRRAQSGLKGGGRVARMAQVKF